MKTLLAGLLAVVVAAWGSAAVVGVAGVDAHPLWLARQQALFLSGYLSIALMSLAMVLATRPGWLETPLGGMDRVYRTHKWAGILGVAFGALHWLVEMSDDILKSTIGRQGRVPKEKFAGGFEIARDLAEEMGEWAIYALLAMLAITLWKKFPYRPWRALHRAMPVLYLAVAFHSLMLAPADYWSGPAGWMLGTLVGVGVASAVGSLSGLIGRARAATGEVVAIERTAPDVTTVRCRLDRSWRGHRPGQFAFVTFHPDEGAHPFTIAGADLGNRSVSFEVKALGDYTRGLAQRLQAGQPVRVEGPYGRFDIARCDRNAKQVWVAGGIGVTPFLAWLESLQADPARAPEAELHYCTRDRAADPFVARLEKLCATLPGVGLTVHGARQGDLLDADTLATSLRSAGSAEVWFCGPRGLADALRGAFAGIGTRLRFHQEAFEMR